MIKLLNNYYSIVSNIDSIVYSVFSLLRDLSFGAFLFIETLYKHYWLSTEHQAKSNGWWKSSTSSTSCLTNLSVNFFFFLWKFMTNVMHLLLFYVGILFQFFFCICFPFIQSIHWLNMMDCMVGSIRLAKSLKKLRNIVPSVFIRFPKGWTVYNSVCALDSCLCMILCSYMFRYYWLCVLRFSICVLRCVCVCVSVLYGWCISGTFFSLHSTYF